MLLVDAAQGIEAQTLANLYLALDADLDDHPGAQQDRPAGRRSPSKYAAGARRPHRLRARRRAPGLGQDRRWASSELLERDRRADPGARRATPTRPPRALIFDSVYDTYRGVVTYVRVVDGKLSQRERIAMMATGAIHEMLEVGVISPGAGARPAASASARSATSSPASRTCASPRVGDTVTSAAPRRRRGAAAATATPSRWSSPGSTRSTATTTPTCATRSSKLQLNDAALAYEPETSAALGFGFRCGFLGLLHMEIVQERLEREFDLDLITTAPNVVYERDDGGRHRAST